MRQALRTYLAAGAFLVSLIAIVFGSHAHVLADTTDSTTYGSGTYQNCDYGSCTITLSSSGAVNVNVTPSPSGSCTVQRDSVTVATDSSTGYTLTLTTSTTATSMTSGSNSVASTTATQASPTTLPVNRWGYRVDGVGGFGAGPTTAQSNGATPSVTFAGVPASNGTPSQLVNTSSAANPAVTTPVWYGLCANSALASGAYNVSVTYTALTN